MRLIVLGAGSIVPTPVRFGSGHYLEAGELKLLLDCGPGVLEKMRGLSLSPFNLSAVLLTHFHIDHVSDIFTLLKLRAFTPEGLPNRSPAELRIFGPKGLKKFLETMIDNNEFFSYVKTLMRYESYVRIEEVEPGRVFEFGSVRLTSAPVKHDGGVAYRIDSPGASLVYSGDTAYSENLIKLAAGVDVLIHECSFPHERLVGQHVSEVELARILAEVRPKIVVVTHLYPIWEGEEHRLVDTLEQSYKCRVVIARDGTELTI